MSKIIVTGGCGYIGSHTCIALISKDYDVVIFDDLSNADNKSIDRIDKITGKRPELYIVDLKDKDATLTAFDTHKDALAVIHFAAYKAVKESVDKPLHYYENNLFSIINTLSAQQKFGIKNFIFSSSATVYGMPKACPVTEQSPVNKPFSPYGNTKKIAEEILEDFTTSNLDFSSISLRYFNPIGAHESEEIGELPNGVPNNLMPYITQTAAGIRKQLMVFGNDYPTKDGTAVRDYIHVMDLAEAHVVAVNRLIKQRQESNFEIYNLGTGTGYSVLEVIKAFETQNNLSLNYKITDRRKGDVPVIYASTELASTKLGWSAKRNLNLMVKSAWNWEKNYRKNN
jgi:UDP-glucose 4-epimerase